MITLLVTLNDPNHQNYLMFRPQVKLLNPGMSLRFHALFTGWK